MNARMCEPLEAQLNAVLPVLHPVTFLAVGVIWYSGAHDWDLKAALGSTLGLLT